MCARRSGRVIGALCALVCVAAPAVAAARVRRVPQQFPTIQAAVDASDPGDQIDVGPGSFCGATVDRALTLVGRGSVIVGCDTGPVLFGALRAGFYLPGAAGASAATGTRVTGFVFDGRGVSNTNLDPLALGIFARFASDVVVEGNRFLGTAQAITNTAGDRWLIARNSIDDFTVLDCTGAFCAGGDGIVIQIARGDLAAPGGEAAPANRPEQNVVADNDVSGVIPDGFDVFSMVGVFVFAADATVVARNRLDIPDNPNADATGIGVLVDNSCCGDPAAIEPGARNTIVVLNDGRRSEVAVEIGGTGGENTQGLILFGNRGRVIVEGTPVAGGPGRLGPGLASALRRHLF